MSNASKQGSRSRSRPASGGGRPCGTRRFRRGALGAAAAAVILPVAAPVQADPLYGAGLFAGYQFGADGGFEFGVEVFAHQLMEEQALSCERAEWHGAALGVLAQFSVINARDVRFSLALDGAASVLDGDATLHAELGGSVRSGPRGGLGIHSGLAAETWYVAAALRHQWLLNDTWLGAGARISNVTGLCDAQTVPGRPLRSDTGRVAMRVDDRTAVARVPGGDSSAWVEAVGLGFERDAQLEAASVPAFLQLARELAASAAPPALIAGARAAADDEVRHSELCAALARRHLRRPVTVYAPPMPTRTALVGCEALTRLAVESWVDGCLVEGAAAAQAVEAARRAADPVTRAVLQDIAQDEQRHTELAWTILRWAIERGGRSVRNAVRAHREVTWTLDGAEKAPANLERHGRLDTAALAAITIKHGQRCRDQLNAVL